MVLELRGKERVMVEKAAGKAWVEQPRASLVSDARRRRLLPVAAEMAVVVADFGARATSAGIEGDRGRLTARVQPLPLRAV